jgi:hypothetical protein
MAKGCGEFGMGAIREMVAGDRPVASAARAGVPLDAITASAMIIRHDAERVLSLAIKAIPDLGGVAKRPARKSASSFFLSKLIDHP